MPRLELCHGVILLMKELNHLHQGRDHILSLLFSERMMPQHSVQGIPLNPLENHVQVLVVLEGE